MDLLRLLQAHGLVNESARNLGGLDSKIRYYVLGVLRLQFMLANQIKFATVSE